MPAKSIAEIKVPDQVKPGDLITADMFNTLVSAMRDLRELTAAVPTRVKTLEDAAKITPVLQRFAFVDEARTKTLLAVAEQIKKDKGDIDPKAFMEEVKAKDATPAEALVVLGQMGVNPGVAMVDYFDEAKRAELKTELAKNQLDTQKVVEAYDVSAGEFKAGSGLGFLGGKG